MVEKQKNTNNKNCKYYILSQILHYLHILLFNYCFNFYLVFKPFYVLCTLDCQTYVHGCPFLNFEIDQGESKFKGPLTIYLALLNTS